MPLTGSNPSQGEPLETRPSFRLGPTQQRLGPLVLDQRKHIQVPSPINTFLRDYQRDGAAFLYHKFRNSMGGMLGDDMGLVSPLAQVDRMTSGVLTGFCLRPMSGQNHSSHIIFVGHYEEDRYIKR